MLRAVHHILNFAYVYKYTCTHTHKQRDRHIQTKQKNSQTGFCFITWFVSIVVVVLRLLGWCSVVELRCIVDKLAASSDIEHIVNWMCAAHKKKKKYLIQTKVKFAILYSRMSFLQYSFFFGIWSKFSGSNWLLGMLCHSLRVSLFGGGKIIMPCCYWRCCCCICRWVSLNLKFWFFHEIDESIWHINNDKFEDSFPSSFFRRSSYWSYW